MIERLRALEKRMRDEAGQHEINALEADSVGATEAACGQEWKSDLKCEIADELATLIAELGQEVGAVAWLKELDGGAVKCVPRDFPGAFPVYRESTPLRCKDGQPGDRNRPAQEPGGVECMKCGCIFIGEEWHSVCAVCLDKPGSERLCDFFADVGEVSRFMDELCNVVTELTGDEGEDDPITVLRRYIASSPAHTSGARENDPTWRLFDRVDFALRDAGFDLDLASAIAARADDFFGDEYDAAMRQEGRNG